VNYKRHITRDV